MALQLAEYVGLGHPDKIADVIADVVLDMVHDINPKAQVACEVLASKGRILVAGEIGGARPPIARIKEAIKDFLRALSYDPEEYDIQFNLKEQSSDIRKGSIESLKGILSGDQCFVTGYACSQTPLFLPRANAVAYLITKCIENAITHEKGELAGAGWDFKVMVCLKRNWVKHINITIQNNWSDDQVGEKLRVLYEGCVVPALVSLGIWYDKERVVIDSDGQVAGKSYIRLDAPYDFRIGGLEADTGANNRKLIAESYGNSAGHGGGGYSGKDLTKVDRLLAYYAHWICVNMVGAGVCSEIELEAFIFCGEGEPRFNLKNVKMADERYSSADVLRCLQHVFGYTIEEVYLMFNKRKDWRFVDLSMDGHFTQKVYPWRKTNKVAEICKYLNKEIPTIEPYKSQKITY